LKHYNVDLNPAYTDSIDLDHFTVHLMLEIPPPAASRPTSMSLSRGPMKKTSSVDPLLLREPAKGDCLKPYYKPGLAAFEAGLDEVPPSPS
jgi:hypothetical protein